ncbi:helix-turn-helix domain-containing protein [Chryseobacterium sp. Bi04]|jgi:hypothetical protein|uniref:helix-turn-helix domain-containing protein n=1 Tax=Chryseobacterium sp. Bi04 TaxID=2822345 RepID=UPI001D1B1186|nr:helix-turn-helix domain-containing protein [Chryseobacterium sp. Bi04]CAH0194380.1 hypothetical protein SRABI04_01820 [Chryseobacterium sp. Bi04]
MSKTKFKEDFGLVNYKKIYSDIIENKKTEKSAEMCRILNKDKLSGLDIIKINQLIFGIPNRATASFNQNHRSYDLHTILEILEYQKANHLNNSQIALHYKISRNTIAKWKKMFIK